MNPSSLSRLIAAVAAACFFATACGVSASISTDSSGTQTNGSQSIAADADDAVGGPASETVASPDDSADTEAMRDPLESPTGGTVVDVVEDGLDVEDADTNVFVQYKEGEVITEVDGEVLDGALQINLDSTVGVQVASDVSEHVHVHGHDIFADVSPDEAAYVLFTADIPGTLEVELEDSRTLLFDLEVS